MSSRSLLMLDGDPSVHELLSSLLQREDRTIQDAYDGREALEYLKARPYDLVLAGQNGLDGLKLLRRIHAIRPDAKVILAGDRNPEKAIGALRARAFGYLHKPLPPGPVSEMVQQALESSSWRDDIHILSARPEWLTLDVRCKLPAAERAIHFFRELVSDLETGPAGSDHEDIIAAFRELLMNGIEHGGKSNPRKRVRVTVLRTARSLTVHMRDPGQGFSLTAIQHAAVCNPDDEPTRHVEIRAEQGQRPGGFGILMASNLVDELVYNERGNEVAFIKYLRQ